MMRGIRGAISVESNDREEILEATRELLTTILDRNAVSNFEDVVSAVFTTTPDLTACFPAEAARKIGMSHVPLLCASEIAVEGGMPRCIRILLHVLSDVSQQDIVHVYLREAANLRPDIGAQ